MVAVSDTSKQPHALCVHSSKPAFCVQLPVPSPSGADGPALPTCPLKQSCLPKCCLPLKVALVLLGSGSTAAACYMKNGMIAMMLDYTTSSAVCALRHFSYCSACDYRCICPECWSCQQCCCTQMSGAECSSDPVSILKVLTVLLLKGSQLKDWEDSKRGRGSRTSVKGKQTTRHKGE